MSGYLFTKRKTFVILDMTTDFKIWNRQKKWEAKDVNRWPGRWPTNIVVNFYSIVEKNCQIR